MIAEGMNDRSDGLEFVRLFKQTSGFIWLRQRAATLWQVALALPLLIGSTVLLVPFAARLYTGAVLRTRGRVKIREVVNRGEIPGVSKASW